MNYPPLEFAIILKQILDNPDISLGELEESNTMKYHISEVCNQIPNNQKEIIELLNKIIDILESNNYKSFKTYIIDFISLVNNVSGIFSTLPQIEFLITKFKDFLY